MVIFTTALPGSAALIAAMNTFWRFPANADISALPVTRSDSVPYDEAVAGGVVAVQTFGDFQNFNPHPHIIATDGCFYGDGQFMTANRPCPEDMVPLFRQEVFKLLKAHGLPDRVIENMTCLRATHRQVGWHHSGFNVYCGPAIWPGNDPLHRESGPVHYPRGLFS